MESAYFIVVDGSYMPDGGAAGVGAVLLGEHFAYRSSAHLALDLCPNATCAELAAILFGIRHAPDERPLVVISDRPDQITRLVRESENPGRLHGVPEREAAVIRTIASALRDRGNIELRGHRHSFTFQGEQPPPESPLRRMIRQHHDRAHRLAYRCAKEGAVPGGMAALCRPDSRELACADRRRHALRTLGAILVASGQRGWFDFDTHATSARRELEMEEIVAAMERTLGHDLAALGLALMDWQFRPPVNDDPCRGPRHARKSPPAIDHELAEAAFQLAVRRSAEAPMLRCEHDREVAYRELAAAALETCARLATLDGRHTRQARI